MIDGKVVVGITQGDINGIGYEVIIKTLSDARIGEMCVPIVYGSPKVMAYHRKVLNMEHFNLHQIKQASEANSKRLSIINCMDDNVRVELGRSTEYGGQGSLGALKAAVADIKAGLLDVLVTAPICKQNVQAPNFTFPGHTEFLADAFKAKRVLMLMVSDTMRVGVVTGHVPLHKVPGLVTQESILSNLRILNETLLRDFGIRKPSIAVLGLNPHAGDNGVIGTEDREVIEPALAKANEEGIVALGPYPADGLFGTNAFAKYNGILAMYHDQGLIPFKAMAYGQGVNYTAGLPIIRTSPAHGTAFDLAGKNEASPDSFRQALFAAIDIFNNRKQYESLSRNPLSSSGSSSNSKNSIDE